MAKVSKSPSIFEKLEPKQLWAFIFLAWMLYRYYVRGVPEWVDELIFKPLVFVAPVLWFVKKIEKRKMDSIGVSSKNFFKSLYIGLGFGFVFALEAIAANAIKNGKLVMNPIDAVSQYGLIALLIFSVATAFSEELLSRGFLFNRLLEKSQNLPYASFISTLFFVFLHVPVLVTSLHLTGTALALFFVTTFVLGFANTFLYFYTGSLIAPILVHVFWNMTVALYL